MAIETFATLINCQSFDSMSIQFRFIVIVLPPATAIKSRFVFKVVITIALDLMLVVEITINKIIKELRSLNTPLTISNRKLFLFFLSCFLNNEKTFSNIPLLIVS